MKECPVPISQHARVLLGHGSGGSLTSDLIHGIFLPAFGNDTLARLEDQATVSLTPSGPRLAFTTDSYVVRPLFFPGGDIGKLAVHGTINDLAVGGAIPKFISAAFILEEGLELTKLQRIVESMRQACADAGVELVTGDTKVVERGKGDEVFINTSGIGLVPDGVDLSIAAARPTDCIIVSGPIGDHGVAILSVREGLEFETRLESDTTALHRLTAAMLEACPAIRCMRDATRGGVAAVSHELAAASEVGVRLWEKAIPMRPAVRGACEMLGLEPLHVACEGRLIAVVPRQDADKLLEAMRAHPDGRDAALVGEVVAEHPRRVVLQSVIGSERVVSQLIGEQLPRIC